MLPIVSKIVGNKLTVKLHILIAVAIFASVPIARSQETITPQSLTEAFVDVCQTALKDFDHEAASLLSSGWQEQTGSHNDETFRYRTFLSREKSVQATLQKFDFEQGTFEQCGVEGYAKFTQANINETLKLFPAAKGKILRNQNGSSSGLWLLTDQPTFTTLNILFNDRAAHIITMRTTYSGPSKVEQ
jgi:hypothetical protein